jgi:hypothetical protein
MKPYVAKVGWGYRRVGDSSEHHEPRHLTLMRFAALTTSYVFGWAT